MGSSLVESVSQNANKFVSTIVETDWQKELYTIQKELHDDTIQIEQSVERNLGISHEPAASAASSSCQGTRDASTTQAGETPMSGFSLAAFSKSFVAGTVEIFETVRCPSATLAL
jgi:hypothetical protein